MASATPQSLIARREAVVARGVGQFAGAVTAASACGALITDADGRELIDFVGGIGVMNVGHCNERVVKAIQEQAAKLTHACIHVATYEPYVALCEKLVRLLPHGPKSKVMLINSGAEAVENAIKIARQSTGRGAVITFTESFHGRTLLATSMTSKTGYKIGCGPFAPELYRLPYPNFFKYGDGLALDEFVERELRRLRGAFLNTVRSEDVAAIMLEIVQGEGGFSTAPWAYLRGLREICDETGIRLIFDEIQSGFCRTGRWAAYEHAGVTPDLSTWAKSMGGGLPISAVIGKADVMDGARPGTLGGTYGGNPVACAAALAAIEAMEQMNLNGRAEAIGKAMRDRFNSWKSRCPAIVDVRGLGAMLALEFCEEGDLNRPAGDLVKRIQAACLERGLLVVSAGAHGNCIRVLCPLVITDDQLERGLGILGEQVMLAAGREAARSR